MTNHVPALTRQNVREEAREILSAIDASRRHREALEDNWRRLWQLVREAKAAYLPFLERSNDGPWHLSGDPDRGPYGFHPRLTAGNFVASIWPPEEARSGTDLPKLLNWAGVPAPYAR
jgi:hypothetical protein